MRKITKIKLENWLTTFYSRENNYENKSTQIDFAGVPKNVSNRSENNNDYYYLLYIEKLQSIHK